MNNRVIPITLALNDQEQVDRLEEMIEKSPMVHLASEAAEEMGVLIYEPGDSVDEDLPHIIHALESGHAQDVYLAGDAVDSDILIRAMRSGIREFLQYPIDEREFRSAVMRTAMRMSLGEDTGEKGKIYTVLGAKAGLGSTTLAVNLACVFNQRKPGSTILMDLRRPSGEVPFFLDLKYEYTWAELTEDISRLDSTYLQSVVAIHENGLNVLAAPTGSERPDPQDLFLILEQLRNSYEYVIVDTSYPHDELLPKEVEQADSILIAMQLTLPCLARTARLMESIRTQDPDAERRMKVVANRVTKNSTIGLAEAAEVLEKPISWSVEEDGDAALSAINQGTPLVIAYPKSVATKSILALAQGLVPYVGDVKGKKFSLPFGSLFKKKAKKGDQSTAGAES